MFSMQEYAETDIARSVIFEKLPQVNPVLNLKCIFTIFWRAVDVTEIKATFVTALKIYLHK